MKMFVLHIVCMGSCRYSMGNISQKELIKNRNESEPLDRLFLSIRRDNARGENVSDGGKRRHPKVDVQAICRRSQETFSESFKTYDFFTIKEFLALKSPDAKKLSVANQRKFIEEKLEMEIVKLGQL